MSALGWAMTLSVLGLAAARRPRPTALDALVAPGPLADASRRAPGVALVARGVWVRVLGGNLDRRDEQLCAALDHVGASLRAGSTLVAALSSAGDAVNDPVGGELRQVSSIVGSGAPLRAALVQWSKRSGTHRGTRLVATALALASDAGGEVARSVDRVGATLRERREVRAEARALATQARASAVVLTVAPLLFTALVATVEADVIGFLVGTPAGVVCLSLGLGLDAVGAWWMARIVRSPA